jgi:uncharacterized protein (TIGR02611 family)
MPVGRVDAVFGYGQTVRAEVTRDEVKRSNRVGRAGTISTLPQLCADRKTAPFSKYLFYYRTRGSGLVPKAVHAMRIVDESPAFDVFSGFHMRRQLVDTLNLHMIPGTATRRPAESWQSPTAERTRHFGTKHRLGEGMHRIAKGSLRLAWRLGVFVVGASLLLAGIIMIVTPGPAIVFIPLGLAVLATEFQWARSLLAKARPMIDRGIEKARSRRRQERRPTRAPAEAGDRIACP